jgi:hypothetical protein
VSQRAVPNNLHANVPKVKSVAELKGKGGQEAYVVFANYIYKIQPLKHFHPCGYQIINSIGDREMDQYMYGIYRS